ncbi:MAG: EhaG family protein [Methanocalculaceae archaeon]|jgi:energy-converting hydrogenase A subunit G|nr:EhaG family protein [Methanocalculaceae archaeon]
MIEIPLAMPQIYTIGIAIAFFTIIIAFSSILQEKDDIHKMIIIDLVEITGLVVIALIATDLAEALILPGLVVGIAEIMAISELWLAKENLQQKHSAKKLDIEVMKTAPPIIGAMLTTYGIFLTGFSGGLIAALGLMIYFFGKNVDVPFAKIENAAGYAWALWIIAFLIFMFIPSQWFLATMLAAVGIMLKVMAKMSLVGTMRGAE